MISHATAYMKKNHMIWMNTCTLWPFNLTLKEHISFNKYQVIESHTLCFIFFNVIRRKPSRLVVKCAFPPSTFFPLSHGNDVPFTEAKLSENEESRLKSSFHIKRHKFIFCKLKSLCCKSIFIQTPTIYFSLQGRFIIMKNGWHFLKFSH